LTGLGEPVEARGEINRVAGHRVLRLRARGDDGGHHFAAGDADVQRQCPAFRIVERSDACVHVERGSGGALPIVVVRNRRTEHRERGIACMVDHMTAVVGDDAVGDVVEAAEQRLDLLGIESGAERGVTGDVRHQHGGLAAIAFSGGGGANRRDDALGSIGGRRGHGMRTFGAEPGRLRQRGAAVRALSAQGRGALLAELRMRPVIVLTTRTLHCGIDR
jgi:hypothetical protein